MLVKCMVDVGERHAGVSEGHGWCWGPWRMWVGGMADVGERHGQGW